MQMSTAGTNVPAGLQAGLPVPDPGLQAGLLIPDHSSGAYTGTL